MSKKREQADKVATNDLTDEKYPRIVYPKII